MRILLVEDEPSAATMLAKGRARKRTPSTLRPTVKSIDLTAKEYALLEYLARRVDEVVSRADISERCGTNRTIRSRKSSKSRGALDRGGTNQTIVAHRERHVHACASGFRTVSAAETDVAPERPFGRSGTRWCGAGRRSECVGRGDERPEAVFDGDQDLLRQMLLNLVDNAVKVTPPNGAVKLGLICRDGEYLLSVTDAGPGVPVEARQHIFERSYRADRTRTRAEDGGAGLGLAIARWIARAHDRDIELEESAGTGTGTKFVVRLPIANGKLSRLPAVCLAVVRLRHEWKSCQKRNQV